VGGDSSSSSSGGYVSASSSSSGAYVSSSSSGSSSGASSSGSSSSGAFGGSSSSGGGVILSSGDAACNLPAQAAATWLAFDSTGTAYNRDIYLVRGDGSGLVQLTTDPTTEKEAAFSNDGTRLTFTSDRSGTMQVYLMDLATKAVTQLTSLDAGADESTWSRDDTQIAFHSGAAVYVMNADGSGARPVLTSDVSFDPYEYPSFSADGTQLLFDRENELDIVKLDGSGFRYVVQNTTTLIETPAVSPDGLRVAFATYATSFEQVAVVPISTTSNAFTTTPVIPGYAGSFRRPAWGPANVLAFERGTYAFGGLTNAVISLSVAPGAPPCDVVASQGDNRNPNWAPVGFQPLP
jgi:dipeptidyl aminopeptidase/acylaminoacyl peptidase